MSHWLAGLLPETYTCTVHCFSSSKFVLNCSHLLAGWHGERHWREAGSVAIEHVVGHPEVRVLYCVATPSTLSFASA